MQQKKYALITGGSQGIGKAIAKELASRNRNLILVALDNNYLSTTAGEIRAQFNVNVNSIGIDLTKENSAQYIIDYCEKNHLQVDLLINNAGFGNSGLFLSNRLEEYQKIMALNNQAMVELTYKMLPMLLTQPRAFIMNTSSMEATLPLPYKAVYTGTKSFVYAFSLALREELEAAGENISVSVLCPGSVITNEGGLQRIAAQGKRAKLVMLSAERVAQIVVPKILSGKRVITPGYGPWWIAKIAKVMPTAWKMKILEKVFRVYK